MNKVSWFLSAAIILLIAAFAFVMYRNSIEIERLKTASEMYAKENESLKIDLEMMRKRLSSTENKQQPAAASNDFTVQQNLKFKAMTDEIQRLKATKKTNNKEREDQVWDFMFDTINNFVDVELSKKLAGFGFKPEDTAICVAEYQNSLGKMKELMLQWYRNEISDKEYDDKMLDVSRDFYKDLASSVGENLASITLSVVLPDPEYRKKMFEGK